MKMINNKLIKVEPMKQIPKSILQNGKIDLRYNPMSIEEDINIPVRRELVSLHMVYMLGVCSMGLYDEYCYEVQFEEERVHKEQYMKRPFLTRLFKKRGEQPYDTPRQRSLRDLLTDLELM